MKPWFYISLFFIVAPVLNSLATNYNMATASYTVTCGSTHNFYDSGGSGSNYAFPEDKTLTFTAGTAGNTIQVVFSSFATESGWDYLYVYDGPNTSSTLLGTYSGSSNPGTITSSGTTLTFRFYSDPDCCVDAGWAATVACCGCSGTPTAGTVSTSSSTIYCGPGSVNLSLSGNTSGCGITYQWQSSTDNSSFSNISGATSSTYATASTAVTKYYRCNVACGASSANTASQTITVSHWTNGETICASAPTLYSGNFCGNSYGAPTSDPGSNTWPDGVYEFTCVGVNNPIFYKLRTNGSGGTVTMSVTNQSCRVGNGLQFVLINPSSSCVTSSWGTDLFCSYSNTLSNFSYNFTGLAANRTYWLIFDGYSGDECTWLFSLSGAIALPIELVSFEGVSKGEYNLLTWQTGQQDNFNHFELESSMDGTTFNTIYISPVYHLPDPGSGFNYSDPAFYSPFTYYRLKMVDNDGTYTHSNILLLDNGIGKSLQINDLFPNPAETLVNMNLSIPYDGKLKTELLDLSGRVLFTEQFSGKSGEHIYTIPLHDIIKGSYILKIYFDQEAVQVKKFIKH